MGRKSAGGVVEGPRGGKYKIVNGKKVYVSRSNSPSRGSSKKSDIHSQQMWEQRAHQGKMPLSSAERNWRNGVSNVPSTSRTTNAGPSKAAIEERRMRQGLSEKIRTRDGVSGTHFSPLTEAEKQYMQKRADAESARVRHRLAQDKRRKGA